MTLAMKRLLLRHLAFFTCFSILLTPLSAQEPASPPAKPKTQVQKPDTANRLTIEVKGGENSVPVENASVYVKFVQARTLRKGKKYELNVKTNRDGIAHVPDSPLGKVLIQIVADGWKSFGHWYEVTESQQTVQIRLERPPKWY